MWILSWATGVQHLGTVMGPLDPESPIAKAGVTRDDVVTAINGQPVKWFGELQDAERGSAGAPVTVTVERAGRVLEFRAAPERKEGRTVFGESEERWSLGFVSRTVPILGDAASGIPAREAGIMPGDLVVSVNGAPTPDWQDVARLIQGKEGAQALPDGKAAPVVIVVSREGREMSFTVVPEMRPSQDLAGKTHYSPLVGISPRLQLIREPAGPIRALGMGFSETWRMAKLTCLSVVKLLQAKISATLMGGPIMIAEIAGKSAHDGLAVFIFLMAFISVNLAILNLLPLPVLDGGQFVIFLIEAVKRKPLSVRFREITHLVGISALAALMVVVFCNDVSRLVTKFSGPPANVTQESRE